MRALTHLEAYLRGLPRGLDSYPTLVIKGSVLRSSLEAMPITTGLETLPEALQALARNPPPHSSWIPSVHVEALRAARRDLLFDDDDALVRAVEAQNRAMFSGVIYGLLFKLVGMQRLLDRAQQRWDQMHRDATFTVETDMANRLARAQLVFPAGLYSPLGSRCFLAAIKAAMEVASGQPVQAELKEYRPTRAMFEARW